MIVLRVLLLDAGDAWPILAHGASHIQTRALLLYSETTFLVISGEMGRARAQLCSALKMGEGPRAGTFHSIAKTSSRAVYSAPARDARPFANNPHRSAVDASATPN